jgi:hypothetical protein
MLNADTSEHRRFDQQTFTSTQATGGSSTNTGAIAGGVVGGIIVRSFRGLVVSSLQSKLTPAFQRAATGSRPHRDGSIPAPPEEK